MGATCCAEGLANTRPGAASNAKGSSASGVEEVAELEYPTVFVNVFIESVEEVVKERAKEKVQEKLPRPRFEIGKRLQEKVIAKVQSKAVEKMKKDMSPISTMMSGKMAELIPLKMADKGITATGKVVFCQHCFFVLKLTVTNVSSDLLLESKKEELASAGKVQSLLGKLPASWRTKIDSQFLPSMVVKKLTEVMGPLMEERIAEKGIAVSVEVCQAADEAGEADGDGEGRRVVDDVVVDLGMEVESVSVCGLDLRVLRRRGDYYAACAGDLPIRSTGVVLWECGVLLADYLGYARWVRGGASVETPCPAGDGAAEDRGEAEVARDESDTKCKEVPVAAKEFSPHPWWMTHPPAPVVPSRFWSSRRGRVLELGGGCGLVTAVLASLGAHVVCSDGDPEALRTAKRNCSEAKSRYGSGARSQWGATDFHQLRWGDPAAARLLVKEFGPFDFVVGSDLLYGDGSPPGPLLDTLAAVASEPGGRGAEVILAAKSRCVDEAQRFCGLARQRGLWSVSLADQGDFLDGYQETFKPATGGGPEVPAYNVIHLSPLPAAAPLAAEPTAADALAEVAPPSPKRRKA